MNNRRPSPIDKLTIAGRLLLIADFVLFGVGFYIAFFFIAENFPPGRYPVVFICMPIFIVCFFFFLIGAWLLERCGVQIYVNKPREPKA